MNPLASPLTWLLLLPVLAYRRLVSPVLVAVRGPACRFEPSCAAYAEEALRTHGGLRGGGLALRRLARCHPWGGAGLDPVPPRRAPRRTRDLTPTRSTSRAARAVPATER